MIWRVVGLLSPVLVIAGFVLAVLLLAFLVGALDIDATSGGGCTYQTEGCDDPSWQNYPPGY